jgi:hypothetical protein
VKHHDLNIGRWEDANGPVDPGVDELRGILRDEIDKLPAKYRMPLILHYFGGLKPDELSKELGIKANTLGVRLHRARKMLGENLQRRGIVVGGAMLATALASMIPYYVQSTVVNRTASSAAALAMGQQLVAADVTANVLGLMQAAQRASIMARVKAISAAVAVGVSAVAGGAEFLSRVKPFGLEFRNPLNLQSLFAPLLERLRNPIRLSDTESPTTGQPPEVATVAAPVQVAPPTAHQPVFSDDDNRASLASQPDDLRLQRQWLAPAPFIASPSPTRTAVAISVPAPPTVTQVPSRFATPLIDFTPLPSPPRSVAPLIALPPSVAFANARGVYAHTSGALNLPTLTLDSRSSHIRSFTLSGGHLQTDRLTVADGADAEFIHRGGSVSTEELAIAVAPSGRGSYTLDGADATISSLAQRIGIGGTARFEHKLGLNNAGALTLGENVGASGTYVVTGGTLNASSLRVGLQGSGAFHQSGGRVNVTRASRNAPSGGAPSGSVLLGESETASGMVDQSGGSFSSDSVIVGLNGSATYVLRGGEARADVVLLGAADESAATFRATHGTFVIGADTIDTRAKPRRSVDLASLSDSSSVGRIHSLVASGAVANALIVGNGGDAVLQLGNRNSTARVVEASSDSATPIINGASMSAKAEIIGWGTLGLRGPLVQNGRVIADAFERPGRELDLSSLARVENSIENPPEGTAGQYAQRLGRLKLPPIRINDDGAYNWGESADDVQPDMVNSVRFTLSGIDAPGSMQVSLLAPEWAASETGMPNGQAFVGFWKVDTTDGLGADTTDLLIRYDASAIAELGLSESELQLWAVNDEGRWVSLSRDLVRLDPQANLIGGAFDGSIEYFAVSAPSLLGPAPLSVTTLADFTDFARLDSEVAPATVLLRSFAFETRTMLFAPATAGESAIGVAEEIIARPSNVTGAGVVPEPGTIGAITLAAAGLLLRRRVRRLA